jgi:hypothetical protein
MLRTHRALQLQTACHVMAAMAALSCGSRAGNDKSQDQSVPSPYGVGVRIRAFQNPSSPGFLAAEAPVRVTGAVFTQIDTFDETNDGKSRGSVYIQDADATTLPDAERAYSGLPLFAPSFIPTDLRLSPGDVLDFAGTFTRTTSIGAAVFTPPQFLPQLSRAVGSARFDHIASPEPTVIDVNDLTDFETGKKWIGMLVTVKNITVLAPPFPSRGRLTAIIAGDPDVAIGPNSPEKQKLPVVSNELYDVKAEEIGAGKTYASLTGICTYFFNLKIAPRSPADLVAP